MTGAGIPFFLTRAFGGETRSIRSPTLEDDEAKTGRDVNEALLFASACACGGNAVTSNATRCGDASAVSSAVSASGAYTSCTGEPESSSTVSSSTLRTREAEEVVDCVSCRSRVELMDEAGTGVADDPVANFVEG